MSDINASSDIDFYSGLSRGADITDHEQSPFSATADINFDEQWVGVSSNINFGESATGDTHTIYTAPFEAGLFGRASLRNTSDFLEPSGIFSAAVVSRPVVINQSVTINARGFEALNFGITTIYNQDRKILTRGFMATQFGYQTAYNLTQYRVIRGYDASLYGVAYVQGGVKTVSTGGFIFTAFGKVVALNTTEDRALLPSGINNSVVSNPIVSPTIIRPIGMHQLKVGTHHIYDPAIKPLGEVNTTYGIATAWYHTRSITPAGLLAFDGGYSIIFDPTQEVQTQSVITSAIFGDTAIRNERKFLYPTSIFDGVVEQWAIITNTNRYYSPAGIDSQIYGNTDIRNKTPSVFIEGISQTELGNTAIGHAIRTVAPSGFDRLLLGRPALTKSPELAPKSFNTSVVSSLFISHRIRTIKPAGFIAALFGDNTAWYRYRYVSPASWLSSKWGTANLTHGLREVIAQGFVREVHGNLWISQGTRFVEPIGINKIYATLPMVGGSREIRPIGFIATEFGARIIPDNIHAYPQGFAGTFGLSAIRLNTQHLEPLGFISVGQQPADRWGYSAIYNLTQYIEQVQNFDRDNGLIPPAWSEWTLIESRDKQINITGFNSLKIGYNNIDNNADPLLPVGITPPIGTRYDVSMIAHGVRYISIDGIEAPIVSSWLVLYNDARVISPSSFIDTQTGLASAESTRRYYGGVGRFESLETGVPMISYAIRHIRLEPRYAIMPPQINLPVIDTLTKYAELRGFETDSYGTASLTITFNIIAPKWAHRDKVGDPYIRNLTPEVKIYGHNSELFGVAGVRTQWRNLMAVGDTLTLFGLAKIADTKQVIDIRGWRSTVAAQKHTVIRTGAPPYSQQIISLDGWFDYAIDKYREGDGIDSEKTVIAGNKLRVPKPSINQNVLYAEGYVASLWGDNRVWSNNIMVDAGIAIHNISANHAVRHKNRVITLTDEHVIKSKIEVGEPRLSPWTIYAVVEAPAQAIKNHKTPALNQHKVDGLRDNNIGLEVFGRPRVDSTIRTVYQLPPPRDKVDAFGKAVLQLTRRIIAPPSFRRSGFGIPSIPFTLQSITMFDKSTPMSLYGESVVTHLNNGPTLVSAIGGDNLVFGRLLVDHKNRQVKPIGYSALTMGSKKNGDNPYMWQGLRVGAHVPMVIGGYDASSFGECMVSLRIRGIELDGWESFISEYDTANFKERMRVSFVDKPIIFETQRITTDGFVATEYSNADIKFGQYFIRPDGNSDQFRKGGYHA